MKDEAIFSEIQTKLKSNNVMLDVKATSDSQASFSLKMPFIYQMLSDYYFLIKLAGDGL